MSKYLGDFALGQTVRTFFSTGAANGGRVDFSNALETADVRVYKNGSTTQRASEAGYTVTSGFDSMVGGHYVAIDTSDNTDAGFFVAGADYAIWLYPDETVDSQSVAACIAEFSIENRFPFMTSLPALSVGSIPLLGIKDRGQLASVTSGSVFALRAAAAFADDTLIGDTLMVQGNTQGYYQSASVSDNALTGDSVTVDPAMTVTPSGGTYPYVLFTGARAQTTNLPKVALEAAGLATDAVNEIVAAVFARAFDATKMSGLTFEQIIGLTASVLLGEASGLAGTTATYRNPGDTADAVVATVDADGNRTAVTRNTGAVA